jgi:hypothetical protein
MQGHNSVDEVLDSSLEAQTAAVGNITFTVEDAVAQWTKKKIIEDDFDQILKSLKWFPAAAKAFVKGKVRNRLRTRLNSECDVGELEGQTELPDDVKEVCVNALAILRAVYSANLSVTDTLEEKERKLEESAISFFKLLYGNLATLNRIEYHDGQPLGDAMTADLKNNFGQCNNQFASRYIPAFETICSGKQPPRLLIEFLADIGVKII